MQPAPVPSNEPQRLARLTSFNILDSLPQPAFDHIAVLASTICETPIGLVSLVDQNRQWFKARIGMRSSETARELAFCGHAILDPDDVMVVEDATLDERFRDNPLVEGDPNIRFYAGAPIVTMDGLAMGTVCAIGHEPRTLSDHQRNALKSLAALVLNLMEREEIHQKLVRAHGREQLRKEEIQASVNAAGLDLLSYVDTSYTYRFVNRTYLRYWNRDFDNIVGHSISDLIGEDLFRDVVRPQFDKALAGREVSYETVINYPGMGERAVEVTYLPAFKADGTVRGVVVRAHDVHGIRTRERRLLDTVDQLEHKALEQQRFIHIISHDLREPINTIRNFAGLLAEESESLPDYARRYLSFVQGGGDRMKTLLDDLLEFLHLDRHEVAMGVVDMNAIAINVCDDLEGRISQRQATVEVGDLPMVRGDATLLRIVLQNLVSNALKFCPPERSPIVSVSGECGTEDCVIRVKDNGIGIEPEHVTRIFEIFTRLNNKQEFPGSGLGLSICRRIADLHKGSIRVHSEPDAGSCFELALPLSHGSASVSEGAS